jgi:four helix bundle protein
MEGGFNSLKVYQLAYQLAMEIFEVSKKFPKEETYSLTDQTCPPRLGRRVRRSSGSVCSNIAEAFRKRRYPKNFTNKISDADGKASETTVWIDFAKNCKYINEQMHKLLNKRYEEVGKILGSMADNPGKFIPKVK